MPTTTAIWRISDDTPVPLPPARLDREARLEDFLVADPSILGTDLLLIGKQVQTAHGGYIDLLAIDSDAKVHVLELKRDKTPRNVVAQTLDYGSWVTRLGLDDLRRIFATFRPDTTLDEAFAAHYDESLPDTVNSEQQFTVVAAELDPTSERIIEFLAEDYGVPINAIFFRYFLDDDREYLTRTWLLTEATVEQAAARRSSTSKSKTATWDGFSWYTAQGRTSDTSQRWEMSRRYGYISAGGGSRYAKPLLKPEIGHRVFAYVAGAGYVGVGTINGERQRLRDFIVDGQPVHTHDDFDPYFAERATDPDDITEYVVPVDWHATVAVEDAIFFEGAFSNQATVCKLRNRHTIDRLTDDFNVPDYDGPVQERADRIHRIHEAINSLDDGQWTTFGDIAEYAGSSAMGVAQHIKGCTDCDGWRILGADGTPDPAGYTWSDPTETRSQRDALEAVGVQFVNGKADPSQRISVS